ncbi:MAG: hypothetical protein AB7U95_15115 [Reyranella sp.]
MDSAKPSAVTLACCRGSPAWSSSWLVLAIVNSIIILGGVGAPLVMGGVVQTAATHLAGYDHGFVILGCLRSWEA